MLRRIIRSELKRITETAIIIFRSFKRDSKNPFLPGGGLDKLQGGIKEEKYFNAHDAELINRIREQGSKLKCEDCIGNWTEFEKVLKEKADLAAMRETCCSNKHKNNLEEAYFLREDNDCCKILRQKLGKQQDNLKVVRKLNDSIEKSAITETDFKQNPPMK